MSGQDRRPPAPTAVVPGHDGPELSARFQLTPSEFAVLHAAARGLNAEETAQEFFVALPTVKLHKTNLFRKLGARSIAQAVAIGYQRGLLRIEGDPEPIVTVVVNGVSYVPEAKAA